MTRSEVDGLVAALRDGTGVQRDAAVARLRIAGARAIDQLATLLTPRHAPDARAAALAAIEGLDDPRALQLALGASADPDRAVAAAAIGVLRGWVTRETGTSVLDALSAIALDGTRDPAVRLAALDALSELPRDLVQPLIQRVSIEDRRQSSFDDPASAREWLARHPKAPLSVLHEFVTEARERERGEPAARRRQDWLVARGAAHLLLARRGSRVALYDLRETFDAAAAALPLDFLTAIAALGDATCLEALARAWSASAAGRDAWWHDRLREVAADIVGREKLTARHAAVKRVRAKWPGFL